MKKLVVLTEHFMPSNTAGANRPASWARYLPEHGYYPVFFTRNVVNDADHYVVKNASYEVHYVKCVDSRVHRLRLRYAGTVIGRAFGVLDILASNWSILSPLKALHQPVLHYVAANEVCGLLATAPSFALFGIASRIARQAKVKWIADYRDDWTTSEIALGLDWLRNQIERSSEIHCLRNVSAFVTVSPWYLSKIGALINKQGYLVENGYDPVATMSESANTRSKHGVLLNPCKFNILYPGTLYRTQKLDFFVAVLDRLDINVLESIEVVIIGMDEAALLRNNPGLSNYMGSLLKVYSRLDRTTANCMVNDCDAVLYIAHVDNTGKPLKGIPSSKLYDYIKYHKRVLMSPSDSDFAEQKLMECGLAVVGDTPSAIAVTLTQLIHSRKSNRVSPPLVPLDAYLANTTQHSAMLLAKLLNEQFGRDFEV